MVTEQLFDEPGAKRLRVLLSLLFGSLMAWSQVRRIGDYLKPQTGPSPWGVIPKGSHRDIFGNRGLWPQSEAELEPGEVLLGVLDGVIGSRQIANMRMTGIIYSADPADRDPYRARLHSGFLAGLVRNGRRDLVAGVSS